MIRLGRAAASRKSIVFSRLISVLPRGRAIHGRDFIPLETDHCPLSLAGSQSPSLPSRIHYKGGRRGRCLSFLPALFESALEALEVRRAQSDIRKQRTERARRTRGAPAQGAHAWR